MKSQKGVTLTALIGYMAVFTIIIGIVTTISSHFYKNVAQLKDDPKYVTEFNKFCMFFIVDVKQNTDIMSISNNRVQFRDGTEYLYKDNSLYRNDKKIAKYVKQFSFTSLDYTTTKFTKKMINVTAEFGKNKQGITRNIDFVLRYW